MTDEPPGGHFDGAMEARVRWAARGGRAMTTPREDAHRYDHDGMHRHHHDADSGDVIWWERADQFGGDFREHRHDQITPREDAIAALPVLRLTGEQLDSLGADEFIIDWDEHDEFVRLSQVRAALGAEAETPDAIEVLDVERLARALHAYYAGKDTRYEFFPSECTHPKDARFIAAAYLDDDPNDAIAREYALSAAAEALTDAESIAAVERERFDRLAALGDAIDAPDAIVTLARRLVETPDDQPLLLLDRKNDLAVALWERDRIQGDSKR